jgi:hypothetical protein
MRHKIFLSRTGRDEAGHQFVGEHEGSPVTVVISHDDWKKIDGPTEVMLKVAIPDPPPE